MDQQSRYESLDFLRGVAAIGVMFFHFSIIGIPIAAHGYLAVDMFFILSGFVMSHAYHNRLGSMELSYFVKIRLIRVLPLSFIGLIAGTIYFLVRYVLQPQSQYSLIDIIGGTLFNMALIPKPWVTPTPTDTIFTSNTPLWSLSLEVLINFIWAAFLIERFKHIIPLIIFISLTLIVAFSYANGSADIGATWPNYIGGLSRAAFGYFVGTMLWKYRPTPNKSLLYSLASSCLLILIIFTPDAGPLFDIIAISIAFPLIIYMSACSDYGPERPLFKFIGNLSFPLYVIHVPILQFLVGISKTVKINDGMYSLAIIASVACIAAAVCLDLLYDRPARKALSKFLFR